MDVVLLLQRWSHECCGPAFERGDRVDLSCVRPVDGDPIVDGVGWVTDRHWNADRVFACRGVVADLWAVADDGAWTPLDRIPSGRALCGFGDGEDGVVRRLDATSEVPGAWPLLITVAAATIEEIDISDQLAMARTDAQRGGRTR